MSRQASLMGIVLWSAHWHAGQWSREYRAGCRARQLLARSNEIGSSLVSRWFDALEHYASGEDSTPPVQYVAEFSAAVRATYARLARWSEARQARKAAGE